MVPPDLHEALLRPPTGSVTRQVNGEPWQLGHDPSRLAAFLTKHGHPSDVSGEVFSQRWFESPDTVLRLARLAAEGPDPAADVAVEAVDTEAPLAKLSPPLRAAVRLTQTYLRLREEQRYHLDAILAVLKGRLLELGARWFEDPSDIRHLTVGELDGQLGVEELRRTAERRAADPVDPNPPDFLVGDDALPLPTDGARLQGLGISPGIARGRVRVIRRPDEGERLLPGEILVARATDPSWTPLFHRAGGLLLELGGLLSHGAVVAREYHLPGVANLPGITQRLVDGTEVTMDGRSGTVWVHG